jgi:elongation factor P
MISASQLRMGMAILYEGQRYKVVAAEYRPGQGRMGGAAHTRLHNLDTGTFWEHSFRAELKIETISVEKQSLEFLYASGDQCCFMHPETFDQLELPLAMAGPQSVLLTPGMKLTVEFVDGRPVAVTFPDIVELKVAQTAPPMHQQADSAFKPAELESGLEVMVPQFIKAGETIRVDAATMKYVDRARTKGAPNAV